MGGVRPMWSIDVRASATDSLTESGESIDTAKLDTRLHKRQFSASANEIDHTLAWISAGAMN
jgi:hypothetical protein